DGELDESIAAEDGDVVLVPRGYHPVAADPRVDLYYLNVMAGPVREWGVSVAPAHGPLSGAHSESVSPTPPGSAKRNGSPFPGPPKGRTPPASLAISAAPR